MMRTLTSKGLEGDSEVDAPQEMGGGRKWGGNLCDLTLG